jgi:hypothetical protein
VVFKGESRENKIYAIIAIFIIIIVIYAVFLSRPPLNPAFINNEFIDFAWSEDISERDSDSQLLGLEEWMSYTYNNNNDSFPAYLSITSLKTLFMKGEDELIDQTLETIQKTSDLGLFIDEGSRIYGERVLDNEHKTIYIIYDGNDTTEEPYEKIKIIGETWNCGISGTSIICIGLAQVTNNTQTNTSFWAKIIKDKGGTFGLGDFQDQNGLIFNVKCH